MMAFAISQPWSMAAAALTFVMLRRLLRDEDTYRHMLATAEQAGLIYTIYSLSKFVWDGRIKDEYECIVCALDEYEGCCGGCGYELDPCCDCADGHTLPVTFHSHYNLTIAARTTQGQLK